MTAENCLFHGSRDCPAARELETLDDQINRRLHAEKIIRETRDALTALLGEIRERRHEMTYDKDSEKFELWLRTYCFQAPEITS